MASTCTEIERPITPLESLRAEPARWVPLAFAAVYILWGSTFLGIRIAIETIPPLAMDAALAGGADSVPNFAGQDGNTAYGRALVDCRCDGCVAALRQQRRAEQRVPSGIAALLIATISLWLVILDWLRQRGTRPGPRVIVGLVVGFAGMALLVGPAKLGGARRIDLVGTGVLVVASFVWACASLYSKQRTMPASPLLVVAMQSLAGAAALWIAVVVSGEFRAVHLAAISGRSWMALIYLVVFGSGMGFTAYLYILKNSTASKVATYAFVNPVVALFLGWMLAGETITTRTAIAAAVILTAVVLVISAPRAQVAEVGDD
jgi:drug/metabolite transporter (DMT)-like permease